MNHSSFNRTRVCWALLAAAFWLSGTASAARADMISYSMILCEDLNVLKNPNDSTTAHNAAWNTQHTLMMERTMPYVEVKNTSATASITQLTASIGDSSKNFDWATLVQASPGVTFSLQTPDGIAGGMKSDLLTINFTGFTPNSFVIFRAGLSPDSATALPIFDYRMTLFQMNGHTDTSGNSQVAVKFSGPDGSGTLNNPLPNFPDNMPTSTSLAFSTGFGMDSVVPFITPNYTGFVQVPEPSSCVLLAGGLAGLAALKLRRRRAAWF